MKRFLQRLTVIIIFIIFNFKSLFAQDTLEFGSNALKKSWQVNKNGWLLENKILKSTQVYGLLENILNSIPDVSKHLKKDTCTIPGQFLLSGCSINNLHTYYTKLYFPTANILNYKTNYSFSFDNCSLNGDADVSALSVAQDHLLGFNNCELTSVNIINSEGWFSFFNNNFQGDFNTTNSNISQLDLSQNSFIHSDTSHINVSGSNIGKFNISGNNIKNLELDFTSDTLSNEFNFFRIISNGEKMDSGGSARVIFKNCFINSKFIVSENTKKISVYFINCSFGKDINLTEFDIDNLVFDNCTKFYDQIDLNTLKPQTLNISFINTELKNFRFNYLGKFKLFFPEGTKQEFKISTFENLLAKFKLEGKLESYKNIDIEYTQYQYNSQGFGGWLKDKISRGWWYYSYRKYYILYWTAGLLLLFFLLNIKWWDKMQLVYPIIPLEKKMHHPQVPLRKREKTRHVINIFVFTAFIFFSLRIDFDKLSYNNSKMLCYFFVQYIVGLACVFFIANAILKI